MDDYDEGLSDNKAFLELDQVDLDQDLVDFDTIIHELLSEDETSDIDENAFKSSSELIDEIKELNEGNGLLLSQLKKFYDGLLNIIERGEEDSKFFPQESAIKQWGSQEILQWSEDYKKSDINRSDILNEAIAVAAQGISIFKGYKPREAQILSSLILLDKSEDQGRLLQVKTGEGKTVICAISAVVTTITKSETVDIITSSSVLAERDAAEMREYYSLFGLTCSHIDKGDSRGKKSCYTSDIVYGDAGDFQGDYLRDHFKGLGTRAGREFKNVIVDEVDSMLVDEGTKITKLSSPRPGAEYLAPIFILTWLCIERSEITEEILSDQSAIDDLQKNIEERISFIIKSGHFVFPLYLSEYINTQISQWAKSAITALTLQENVHYVISKDEVLKIKVIAPVDYTNSGVVRNKTNWGDGIHQFLQVKHKLRMSAEGGPTSFISNVGFFMQYGKNIMGMSGTLGSEDAQKLLSDQYNLDIAIIPKYKQDLFYQKDSMIVNGADLHMQSIIESAIKEADSGRVVLVICQNISFSEKIEQSLKSQYTHSKIFLYNRNDNADNNWLDKTRDVGSIIIATNLAGRGTDIKLSSEVNANGGLHVIVTMLPNNLRVEEQAMGRTAREGNPGSGQIIISLLDIDKTFGFSLGQDVDSLTYQQIRDIIETKRLQEIKDHHLKNIIFRDLLFSKFNDELYQVLKKSNDNVYRLAQLEESWGFWLLEQRLIIEDISKHADILEEFEKFKDTQTEIYNNQRPMDNSAYQIRLAHSVLGVGNSYDETIRLLNEIINFEDPYNFNGHYYLAYAYLRQNLGGKGTKNGGAENKPECMNMACQHLMQAHCYIEDVLIAQTQALQLIIGAEFNGSELEKQLINKIDLLNIQLNYIKNALNFIDSRISGKNIITIGGGKKILEDFFDKENSPDLEIQELYRLGVLNLYELDAIKPPRDLLSSGVVVLIGLAQTLFSAMAAIATCGAYGIGGIISGIKDVYLGVDSIIKGEGVDLKLYFKEKAIAAAIDMLSDFSLDKLGSFSDKFKLFQNKGASEVAKNLTTKQVCKQIGIKIGAKLLSDQAVKVAAKHLSKTVFKKSIDGEIKKAVSLIEERLGSGDVKYHFENIIAVNKLCISEDYRKSIDGHAGEFFTTNKDEISQIAENFVSTAAKKAISRASGNGAIGTGVKILVETATTGASIAVEIEKIGKIAGNFSDHMSFKIIAVGNSLPGNIDILRKITIRNLTDVQAHNLERYLINAGIFIGRLQIESSLVVKQVAATMQQTVTEEESLDDAVSSQHTQRLSTLGSVNSQLDADSNDNVPEQVGSENKAVKKSKSPAIKPKHMDEINPGGDLQKAMPKVRKSLQKMDKVFSARGHLSDNIIRMYAEAIAAKMRGDIRSGIIKPAIGQMESASNELAGIGFGSLQDSLIEYVTKADFVEETEKEAVKKAARDAKKLRGAAAGDIGTELYLDRLYNEKTTKDEPEEITGLPWLDEGQGSSVDRRYSFAAPTLVVDNIETVLSMDREVPVFDVNRSKPAPIRDQRAESRREELQAKRPGVSCVFREDVGGSKQQGEAVPRGGVEIFGTNTAHASISIAGFGAGGTAIIDPITGAVMAGRGIASAIASSEVAASLVAFAPAVAAGTIIVGIPAAIGAVHYYAAQNQADSIKKYSELGLANSDRDIKITSADLAAANPIGSFDYDNPYDRQAIELIARGIAIEREDQAARGQISGGSSAFIDIDPEVNSPKPLITPLPETSRDDNITWTPVDDRTGRDWTLPGSEPVEIDYKDSTLHTPVHESDWRDSVVYKDVQRGVDLPEGFVWEVKPSDNKIAPEIYRCGGYGKIYKDPEQKIGNKDIWWSKDTAKHGGSEYKLFVKGDKELKWVADVDKDGKVLWNKHKSPIGEKIKIKDCSKVK